jgi:hypothetical protein
MDDIRESSRRGRDHEREDPSSSSLEAALTRALERLHQGGRAILDAQVPLPWVRVPALHLERTLERILQVLPGGSPSTRRIRIHVAHAEVRLIVEPPPVAVDDPVFRATLAEHRIRVEATSSSLCLVIPRAEEPS